VFVHWNTEGLPDLRIPWGITGAAGKFRSWLERLDEADSPLLRQYASRYFLQRIRPRLIRFRYVGDYLYAYQKGWIDVFADISAVYADIWRKLGIPSLVAPFGSFPGWHTDLHLERDIDVLWMGKRASKRRSDALDLVRAELRSQGVEMLVIDNEENPFVFDSERTRILNRTKIAINLLRTWYDENSLRICIAAPNRALIVSEPLLQHVPQYQAGVHYVSAPIESLASTIIRHLHDEAERKRIVDNAHRLLTTELTFENSIRKIMEAALQNRDRAGIYWAQRKVPVFQMS
jgi:hypothetical protein